MKANHLYIIGPITGKEDENRQEFAHAELNLRGAGYEVSTPHLVIERAKKEIDAPCEAMFSHWEPCIEHSLRHILFCWDYICDPPTFGIAMLDGWDASKGATIEHDLAVALGIPCKPWREWLEVSNG